MKYIVLVMLLLSGCVNAKVHEVAIKLEKQSASLKKVSCPAAVTPADLDLGYDQKKADAEWERAWAEQEKAIKALLEASGG